MARFARLRQLLSGEPTWGAWEQLLGLFLSWPADDDRDVAGAYASDHLAAWPDGLRMCSATILQRCFATLSPEAYEAVVDELSRPLAFGRPRHPVCTLTRSLRWNGARRVRIRLRGMGGETRRSIMLNLSHFEGLTEAWIRYDRPVDEDVPVLREFVPEPVVESLSLSSLRILTLENVALLEVSFLGQMLRLRALRLLSCRINAFQLAERLTSLRHLEMFGSEVGLFDWDVLDALDYLCLYETSLRSLHEPKACGMYEGMPMAELQSRYALRASGVIVSPSGYTVEPEPTPIVTTVGRGVDVDVQIHDDGVSRTHFTIEQDGASFVLRDLQSMNGTKVNGESVDSTTLTDGDVIEIGESTLLWAWQEDAEKRMAVPCVIVDGVARPVAFRPASCDIPVMGEQFVLGRIEDCELVLADPWVGRRHCALELREEGYHIVDYGSANGVYVNGQQIPYQREFGQHDLLLQPSDEIVIGQTRFEWRQEPRQQAEAIDPALEEWRARPCHFTILSGYGEEQGTYCFDTDHVRLADVLAQRPDLGVLSSHLTDARLRRKGLVYGVFCADAATNPTSWVTVNGVRVGEQPVFLSLGDVLRLYLDRECLWIGRWEGKGTSFLP